MLKCVLPVYKRCEDELSAKHLTTLLMNVSNFLSTLNTAPFTFNVNTSQLQHTFGEFAHPFLWSLVEIFSPYHAVILVERNSKMKVV